MSGEKVSIQLFCESDACFVFCWGDWDKSKKDKKKVSSCCHEFYTPSLSIQWLIHLFTHSAFRRELDTIFKPEQSGDQWAKVHAVFIFLSAVVSILTSAKNHYSSSATSTSFIFALPSKMEAEQKLITTTQESLN